MIRGGMLLALVWVALGKNLRYEEGVRAGATNSWVGFLVGPLLIIIAFPIIWYNQRKASIDTKHLSEAKKICESYPADGVIPCQKLVHISGQTAVGETLNDSITGVSAHHALRLNISVQVKEWRKMGGGSQSPIGLEWVDRNIEVVGERINSPSNWVIQTQAIHPETAHLGLYKLSRSQISQCNASNPINLTQQNVDSLKQHAPALAQKQSNIVGEYIYFSQSNDYEQDGSLRVKASYCPVGPISVLCQVHPDGSTLTPFSLLNQQNRALCHLSQLVQQWFVPLSQINLVKQQILTKEQLINSSISENTTYTYIIRVLSFIMIILGILLFLSPITSLLGYIPIVGGFLRTITTLILFVAALLITIPVYIIALSAAWLFYHPKIGVIIVCIGVGILVGLIVANSVLGGQGQSELQQVVLAGSERVSELRKGFYFQ